MIFSFVLANSPEEEIKKYQSSSAAENPEDCFSVTGLTGLSQKDIALEKRIVELVWNTIDEQLIKLQEKKQFLMEQEKMI